MGTRSKTHFKANGRPASLKVIVDEGKEFTLSVKDYMVVK